MGSHPFSRNRVLMADVDAAYCISARRALERRGFIVTIAHDGADILSRFTPERYDVLVVGLNLKRLNGLDILHHLKDHGWTTPVILLCEEDSIDAAKAGVDEGASGFIVTGDEDYDGLIDAIDHAFEPMPSSMSTETLHPPKTEAESPSAMSTSRSAQLMQELIDAIHTQPFLEIMHRLAVISARLFETAQGVVLLTNAKGLQIATPLDAQIYIEAARDFLERPGDGFAYRVGSARKTLIDAMALEAEQAPIQFIGAPMLVKEKWIGVLVVYPLPDDQSLDLDRVIWLELFAALGALAADVSRLKEENHQLSPYDPVTGLLKRETFLEMADREFRRCWRYHHSMTALVIDVDEMSNINLRYGHEFGDVVLHAVAGVCRDLVRSIDLVGRFDDDSIALALPMTGQEGVHGIAERIRVGIDNLRISSTDGPVQITATTGVCVYPRDNCASVYDLLAATQEAQRRADQIGPNQIVYD